MEILADIIRRSVAASAFLPNPAPYPPPPPHGNSGLVSTSYHAIRSSCLATNRATRLQFLGHHVEPGPETDSHPGYAS